MHQPRDANAALTRARRSANARSESLINQRFAVEFDRRTVGVAVRVPGGFMFYSSDDRFDRIDGRVFPRARSIQHQLQQLSSLEGRRAREGYAPIAANHIQ